MKSGNYLSRLQFFISLLFLLPVFLILPLILKLTTTDEIKINTIRTLWESSHLDLPVPTHYAIYFTDNMNLRITLLILFILIGSLIKGVKKKCYKMNKNS